MAIRLSDQIVRRLTVGIDSNYTNQPHGSYELYVKGNTLHNGVIYLANQTGFWIDNSANAKLRTLGIAQTDGAGLGISLYGGPNTTTIPTYGIVFATTANFGKYGNVQGDWATYLTMSDTTNRGWIFRRGSTAAVSIAGNGTISTIANTSTHINGLTGTQVAINMTSGAGYLMLARIKSTDGRFNLGVYNHSFDVIYGADSITTNTYTYSISLLGQNGVTSLRQLLVDGANHMNSVIDMEGYMARIHGKAWVYGPLHIGRSDALANTGYKTDNIGANNYIAFYGVYGDNPGGFNHTYIGERIYGSKTAANESSELLLFHGNDAPADRIRIFSGNFSVDVFSTATSGTWDGVGTSANAIQAIRADNTNGIILGNTTARSNGINQTTINGHVVINGSYNTNNSYSEGLRINKSSNNWSVIQLGGAAGSTTGTGDGQYLFGVNPDGYSYWSHNGSNSAASRIQGHKGNGWSIRPRLYVNTDCGTGYNFYVNGTSYFTGNVIMAATTESTSATTGTLRVDGGVGIAKDLNARSITRNGDNYVLAPGGGYFTTTTSSFTGALKITLPQSWTSTMMDFFVDIYNYASHELATYHIGGYNYASSKQWVNVSAYCTGVGSHSNLSVRFCHDGSKCCITIGETTTTWSYPQVTVRGFSAKYSGTEIEKWRTGWSVNFVSSLPTISPSTAVISDTALVQTDTEKRMAYYSTVRHIKSAPNFYTDGSTYFAMVNNSTNNSYDAYLYVENKTSNDWGMKIVKDTANYGLYIQATGDSQLRVGTNEIFKVNQKSIYLRPNNTEQMLVDENHTRVIARQAASNPYGGSGIEIREVQAVGTAQSSLAYAPKLGFHWGSRYSAFIALHEHRFKFMADGGGSYRPIVVGTLSSSWIAGHNDSLNAGVTIVGANNTGSYWPWLQATNTGSTRFFSLGNLGNAIYLISSKSDRPTSKNDFDRGIWWDGSTGLLRNARATTNQVIQLTTTNGECSILYSTITSVATGNTGTLNEANATNHYNWVVGKQNATNFGWWNQSYWLMTLHRNGTLWLGRSNTDGVERQIGINNSAHNFYMYITNAGQRGLYSSQGGRIVEVENSTNNNRVYFADSYNHNRTSLAYSQAAIKMYKANIQDSNVNTGVIYYTAWNGYELRAVSQNYLMQRYDWWSSGNGRNVNNLRGGVTFAYTNHGSPPTTGTIVAFDCASNENYTLQLMGSYGGVRLYFRNRNGDNGTWQSWKQVLTTTANTATGDANRPIYINADGAAVVCNEKLGAAYANGYWGMGSARNEFNVWIRTTTQGIIPYQSGGAGSGHCGLGTSSWYFSYCYVDNDYAVHQRSSGRAYMGEWIEFSATNNGLYFPNGNGGHFHPNTTTSYGTFSIRGARGGYVGINFGNSTAYMTVMDNGTDKGIYQDGKLWILYYNKSNNRVGIRTSSLTSYAVTNEGDFYVRNGWLRTGGSYGLYFESYGGGWNMSDTTWIRAYNNKSVYTGGTIRGDTEVWGDMCRLYDNWLGFYSAQGSGTRYGYIQANANRMYFRKENGVSTYHFDFNGHIYTPNNVYCHSLWANQTDGEKQIGVDNTTSRTLYLFANNSEKGLYSSAGYMTGYIIRITSNRVYFADAYNRTNTALAYSQSALAASSITYLTCWNGYELRAITKAEVANAVVGAGLYWANVAVSRSSNTGTAPTFNRAYVSNWFRCNGACGIYWESYGGGWYMTDTTWIRSYNSKYVYIDRGMRADEYVCGGYIYLTSNWIGFYSGVGASGARRGYIQTDGNRMYFRKENGVNGGLAFDFNGALYTNGNGIHAQHGHIFNVAGNEFNWIPDGYNSTMWFNYETYNRQNNGTISEYICGNGRHGHANLRAAKVFNAVWNDFAEYREGTTTEPGRVVAATALSNKVAPTTERLQPCAHVISDTFGCSVGQSDTAKTPIGVGGRVLVFPYQPIENYHVGDCLCAAPNGTADIMTREEIMLYPDRIIGIVDEIPTYKVWKQTLSTDKEKSGSGKVETNTIVNGRIWIYVR